MDRLQNNLSIGWVHPKSTHAHPLAWGNKKLTCKPITLFIQPTLDSPTPKLTQKVFPQCLYETQPTNLLFDVILFFPEVVASLYEFSSFKWLLFMWS
jgi:hypothetical protein